MSPSATQPNLERSPDPLFETLRLDNFRPAELCLALLIGLANSRWRQPWRGATKLVAAVRTLRYQLAHDPILAEVQACWERPGACYPLPARALLSFWACVLGVPDASLCELVEQPPYAALRRALGLDSPCHPQRLAEFHQVIGSERRARLYARCKDLLRSEWGLDRLNEADVERAVAGQTFEPLALEMGQAHGFSAFLTFVFWQGVFSQLEGALQEPLADNGYSLRELLASYLRRFDTTANTPEALSGELRNGYWEPGSEVVVAPVSQTMRNFLQKLAPDRVIALHGRLARRALRARVQVKGRRTRLLGAVDATLLELFGQFEGQEKLFDHVTNQVIKGYKLYVLFEVETRYPLAFVLHTPGATTVTGAPKGDAEYLVELIEQVKQEFGLDHFGCVLFDKGFWSQAHFGRLDAAGENLVTPGKNFATLQAAVASLPPSLWRRVLPNERVADTTVTLGQHTFRLVVWKKLGWRVVRQADGRPRRDAQGKVLRRTAPVIFTYLTNLSAAECDPDQIVALYGRRWGVEDFFEQTNNQYGLGRFPGTALALVKVHIALTLIGYLLLRQFQQQAAEWLGAAEYATMELRRFSRDFLRAPLEWLRWRRTRAAGQRTPRLRPRHVSFVAGLLNLDPAPD
mgnify:CR=1 FL=1